MLHEISRRLIYKTFKNLKVVGFRPAPLGICPSAPRVK